MPSSLALTRSEQLDVDGYSSSWFKRRKMDVMEQRSIGPVKYTEDETNTWMAAFKMTKLQNAKTAWSGHLRGIDIMEGELAIDSRIPQMEELAGLTGATFHPVPVCGYIRPHLFYAALKHGMFPFSSYVRPHANTAFSKEPDIWHEICGHFAGLLDTDFANLHRHMGEASTQILQGSSEEVGMPMFQEVRKGILVHDGGWSDAGVGQR